MATRAFPVARSVLIGALIVGLGTWAGMGTKSALGRARDKAALAEVDAHEPRALRNVRASEQVRLEEGPLPIERAMDDMTVHGRLGVDARLSPQPSNDVAPLQGWAFRPNDVPPWMLGGGGADASK